MGEMRVLSHVSGMSLSSFVSSLKTPKKIFWGVPSDIVLFSILMTTFESGWLNIPPLLVNKFSAYVMNWGYELMRERVLVS